MTIPANPPGGEDGGPAFPHPQYPASQGSGMSLRDWFAGQALSSEAMFRTYHTRPDLMAGYAYELADEMLKARASLSSAHETIRAMREALVSARSLVRNARGAVESGQVTDKDVHGTLVRCQGLIDAALTLAAKEPT